MLQFKNKLKIPQNIVNYNDRNGSHIVLKMSLLSYILLVILKLFNYLLNDTKLWIAFTIISVLKACCSYTSRACVIPNAQTKFVV